MEIYFKGYKNFNKDYVGLEEIKPFNILIGKNNIGKSSFLDFLPALIDKKKRDDFQTFKVIEVGRKEAIKNHFPANTSGGDIGGNHQQYGLRFLNKEISMEFSGKNEQVNSLEVDGETVEKGEKYFKNMLLAALNDYFREKKIVRLDADRNLVPEVSSQQDFVSSDGTGATNLVRQYINKSTLNGKLVEKKILSYLNEIMEPDFFFTDIVCQEIDEEDNPKWEIFLEEETKGRISLTNSGSGLRTVLLLLINLILVPNKRGFKQNDIIYIFEELENNLHPSIQRKLFMFLKKWIEQKNCICFLTTHSNVPLNLFATDNDTQVIHIYKTDEEIVDVKLTLENIDNNYILDDIGVQASDIMQSNCVIWVEGPSDRIYLNKWIELFSKNTLVEEQHYQILFYGGRLLSHLSAQSEDTDFINLLRANRNSIILMDSDKHNKQAPINATKKRIVSEFENKNSYAWVTKGREIENYVSYERINEYFKLSSFKFNQFDKIDEVLDKANLKKKQGTKYSRNKVFYSRELVQNMTEADLKVLDLKKNIQEVSKRIKKWNGL